VTDNSELGQSRLDSLYVIADPIFDNLDSALNDLEELFVDDLKRQELQEPR